MGRPHTNDRTAGIQVGSHPMDKRFVAVVDDRAVPTGKSGGSAADLVQVGRQIMPHIFFAVAVPSIHATEEVDDPF